MICIHASGLFLYVTYDQQRLLVVRWIETGRRHDVATYQIVGWLLVSFVAVFDARTAWKRGSSVISSSTASLKWQVIFPTKVVTVTVFLSSPVKELMTWDACHVIPGFIACRVWLFSVQAMTSMAVR